VDRARRRICTPSTTVLVHRGTAGRDGVHQKDGVDRARRRICTPSTTVLVHRGTAGRDGVHQKGGVAGGGAHEGR
jgi:hypothetical protein